MTTLPQTVALATKQSDDGIDMVEYRVDAANIFDKQHSLLPF